MNMRQVSFENLEKVIENYQGELSVDHSFLHDPPAVMYWDFDQPEGTQLIAKKYQDEDAKRKPTGMKYFIREDL